ncbi:protein FAN-like isoform X2 [Mercenaria mercenaria]|uniref:protein FAN-like isoform X2 n=1 Tax=Mercenaria mercenaria TaxID=6596 RepID=UPI00234EFB3A|nr:protein FAN-like isoform X2 [Mercenaria mercenaria]
MFSLNYVTIADCLPLICQLHRASTLPPADQNTMIGAIVMSRQSRVKFNTSWLDDLYEKVELQCQADKIMPLVTNPGRVMVTTSRLYFQPFNNVERSPVIKVRLKDIVSLMKRRFLLKQIGLEIKCSEHGTSQPHLYLAFKTRDDRDALYDKIMSQPEVNLQMPDQKDMTMKWQNGVISNYDYLMYLNSVADRSFFDLTQYPVMPWVIQDFTSEQLDLENAETFRDLSKPIGALNPERLERMKERYIDMPEPKFLYGSHYSTPGYVLFYLARLVPEYVLCLQNGKFDQPDRMFNSLWEVWQNCLNGAADFKELIPEFFDGNGEYMINSGVCNFGVRQDGRPIGNVDLPPWAKDSRDFIKKMREALECEYVSRHLHEWIDLVFGHKQRGEEAEKADNVFYYLTYEGSIDLDSIKDPNERACMEIQIMEFGQVPKQLLTTPHPARFTSKEHPHERENLQQLITHVQETPSLDTDNVEEETVPQTVDFTHMHKLLTFSKHKDTITDVKLCLKKKMAFSVSQDSLLKLYSLEEQRQLRSVTVANMALSSCIVMPDCKTVICGAWDNNVYFYSVEYGNILDTLHAHDDAVITIYWRNDLLFTASWDSTVKLWQLPCPSADEGFIAAEYFVQLDHDHGVSDLAVDENCDILVSATREGQLYVWDLQKYALKNVFQAHEDVINAIRLDQGCNKIVSCGADSYLRIIDLVSGTEIFVKDIKEVVLCLAMVNNIVILGTSRGWVQVWDMEKVQMLHQFEAHKGAVTCLHMTDDMHLLSGSEDRSVCVWKPSIK